MGSSCLLSTSRAFTAQFCNLPSSVRPRGYKKRERGGYLAGVVSVVCYEVPIDKGTSKASLLGACNPLPSIPLHSIVESRERELQEHEVRMNKVMDSTRAVGTGMSTKERLVDYTASSEWRFPCRESDKGDLPSVRKARDIPELPHYHYASLQCYLVQLLFGVEERERGAGKREREGRVGEREGGERDEKERRKRGEEGRGEIGSMPRWWAWIEEHAVDWRWRSDRQIEMRLTERREERGERRGEGIGKRRDERGMGSGSVCVVLCVKVWCERDGEREKEGGREERANERERERRWEGEREREKREDRDWVRDRNERRR
ncbi:hypothetical protein Tco_0605623 [Tanacetum coccineum]